jgi:hypothetical protein
MTKKRTSKKTTILIIVTVISILIFSNFDLTKEIHVPIGQNVWLLPVPVLFPLLFLFLYVNIEYLKFSYAEGKTLIEKIIFGMLNFGFFLIIFMTGFTFWKYSLGDIDVFFKGNLKSEFQLNFRNLFFWVFYQTLLMVYGLSVLKILVSKMKK